jgi:hypothetical protein
LGKADDRFILDDNGIIGMCLFFWLFSLWHGVRLMNRIPFVCEAASLPRPQAMHPAAHVKGRGGGVSDWISFSDWISIPDTTPDSGTHQKTARRLFQK